ncbi:MAG: GAF domain-containing protein, partial [Planctomycetes bacterium]|nr:GAF domain-containing protein [Planctomycetota bacterium]
DGAARAFGEASRLAQRLGHLRHLASSELNLGVVAKDRGELLEATRRLREARTICEHVGDEAGAAIATSNLGITALLRDDLVGAREALTIGRQRLAQLGDVASARLAAVMLARAELRSGDRDAAARLLDELGAGENERMREEIAALQLEMAGGAEMSQDGGMHDAQDDGDANGALFRTFLAVNRKLAQARDLDEAMRGLLDAAVTLTGGRRGYLLVQRDDGMRREFDSGSAEQAAQAFSRSLANRAIHEQRTLTGADVLADEELQAMQSVRNLRVRSAICAPFDSAAGVRGAIYVEHAGRAGVFRDADCRALEVLADQAAIAVDRMQREEAMRSELSASQRELAVVRRARGPVRLLGASAPMRALNDEIDKLARLDLAVLVTGETGTGKE